jgi:hypothetical protein
MKIQRTAEEQAQIDAFVERNADRLALQAIIHRPTEVANARPAGLKANYHRGTQRARIMGKLTLNYGSR